MSNTIQTMPDEKPVSLAPLNLEKALTGLLQVKPPADKAQKPNRKKAPPAPEKE